MPLISISMLNDDGTDEDATFMIDEHSAVNLRSIYKRVHGMMASEALHALIQGAQFAMTLKKLTPEQASEAVEKIMDQKAKE